MRIVFTVSGGFAPVASLDAPLTIDVATLPQPEQDELRQLVQRTGFFELPARRPRLQGADTRTYTIAIEDGGRSHTVVLADPLPAGELRILVDRLRWRAAVARRLKPDA